MLALCIAACDRAGDLALVPTYISIENVSLAPTMGLGTEHHDFRDIWVYADSQFIGSYGVPSEFPIIGDGEIALDLFAGIRENGQALSPVIYPLVGSAKMTITTSPDSEVRISPIFSYADKVVASFLEDFESTNAFRRDLDGDTLTFVSSDVTNSIDGRSGRSILTMGHEEMEVSTSFTYDDLPTNGAAIYLEMEYAASTPLAVGLQSKEGNSIYKLALFANDLTPEKVYINLTQEVEVSKSSGFYVIFRSLYDKNIALDTQEVIIDNIKLLHFRS